MSPLTDYEARLVRLFVGIVLGRWDDVRTVRKEAPTGEPDAGWREAVLQAHLFAGIPRVVEALEVLEKYGGLGEESEPAPTDAAAGDRLFERIYRDAATDVRGRLETLSPNLATWIREHAYGRVLSRPGLDAATRELLAVAGLSATAQTRQLASHTKGALACGATAAQVHAVLDLIEGYVSADIFRAARSVALKYAPIDV